MRISLKEKFHSCTTDEKVKTINLIAVFSSPSIVISEKAGITIKFLPQSNRVRIKKKYISKGNLEYFYPPKWNINLNDLKK